MRKNNPALSNIGEWKYLGDLKQPYPMIYLREWEEQRFCIIINPTKESVSTTIPTLNSSSQKVIVGKQKNIDYRSGKVQDKIRIKPLSAVIVELI